MRFFVLFGIVLLTLTQALPLAMTDDFEATHKRLEPSGSGADGPAASSGTYHLIDTSRQPHRRECGLAAEKLKELSAELDKAKARADQLRNEAQKLRDDFVNSDGVQALKDKAEEILDQANDTETVRALKDKVQDLIEEAKHFDGFQSLKDKVEEFIDGVKAEGEKLVDRAKEEGSRLIKQADEALDKAKSCDKKPGPNFFRFGH